MRKIVSRHPKPQDENRRILMVFEDLRIRFWDDLKQFSHYARGFRKRFTMKFISHARLFGLVMLLTVFSYGVRISSAVAAPSSSLPALNGFAGNYLAAMHAFSHNDIEAAGYYAYNALLEDPENYDIKRRIIYFNLIAGNYERARPFAVQMVENNDPGNNLAELFLILDDIKQSRFQASQDALERLIAQSNAEGTDIFSYFTSHLLYAWVLAAHGETDAAVAHIMDLDEEGAEGFMPLRLYHSALMYDYAGRSIDAEKAYKRAIKKNPYFSRSVYAYARFLGSQKRYQDAINVIEKYTSSELINLSYDLINLSYDLIALQERLKKQEENITSIVDEIQKGVAEGCQNLAAILESQKNQDSALLFNRFATMLNDDFSLAHLSSAFILRQLNQNDFALKQWQRIEEDNPFWKIAQLEIASTYQRMEDYPKAKNVMQRLIEHYPYETFPLSEMGTLLQFEKKYEEAEGFYSQAIDLIDKPKEEDWQLYYYRGITYERTKRWSLAEQDFQMALKLSPKQAIVLNYLGYIWIDLGFSEHYEEALNMIKQAVVIESGSGHIVDSLGWAYYKLGRYQEAAEALERALALTSDDPVINDHLGDAYWRVGRQREAVFQWSHALTLESEEIDIIAIKRKIEIGLDAFEAENDESDKVALDES